MRRTRGERWYTRLLRLYPRDFRDTFGREMTQLYRDRRRAESGWRLWYSLMLDLMKTAPSEHWSMVRHDVRDAWRTMRRTPIVTTTAALTLALGVGASTAMFTIVYGVLLRPLPYPDADRLVELSENNLATGAQMRASLLNYLSWAERSQSLEALAAFQSVGSTLTGSGDPEPVSGLAVTPSLFAVLGVSPLVGRGLQNDDERRGSPRVVVLGEALWRTRFGADRQIVGRTITLDGERCEVVGVVPRTFRDIGRSQIGAPAVPQFFLPISIDRARENRGNHTLRVAGRLRRGVQIEQAREEMRAVAAALALEFPSTNANWSVRLEAVTDTMHDPQVGRSLILMLGAVAMVFLIGCGNVANLLLVRGATRGTELALRTALGAGRSRLVRQLLTESACLSGVSGAAGVLTATVAHPLILSLVPPTVPRVDEMRVDAGLVAVGLALSIVSGLVFGLVPALTASRFDPSRSLSSAGRASTGVPRGRMRHTLVAGQIALSTMLLIAAALLLQGLVRLQHVPLGFDGAAVWTSRISLPRGTYSEAPQIGQFYQRLLTALSGSGHVAGVAIATSAPFGPGVRAGFQVDPRPRAPESTPGDFSAAEHIVSHDYFRVLRIPVVAGRPFTEQDRDSSPAVALVSQRFARNVWPDTDPRRKTLERAGRTYQVVGIVGDVRGSDVQGPRGGGADRQPRAAVYFAASQMPQRSMTLIVRASGAAPVIDGGIRHAIRAVDPALPVQQVRPLTAWFADSIESSRVTTIVAAAFAICALLLTLVGIYGVLAYSVASRTREIGVRMAIGATRGAVMRLVVGEGMVWAGSGILIGILAALAASRFLASLLFEVSARDPMTFAVAAGATTAAALLACAIPAARAVRVDPTIAIRGEFS